MADTASNQEREMRVAVERVVGFAQEFGEAHLNLACHAAFPLSLTPDLLYQIWANFVPEAPWTAVARVLLSRLCKQVGADMYEMENSVRNLLLRELKVQFGQERFNYLGEFLLEYIGQRLTEEDPDTQDLREAQEWTILAYTKPEQAARELAQVLNYHVQEENIGEVLRFSDLLETFSEPLVEAGFEPLLVYGKGMKSYVCGDFTLAKKQLEKVLLKGNKLIAAGIECYLPFTEDITTESQPDFQGDKINLQGAFNIGVNQGELNQFNSSNYGGSTNNIGTQVSNYYHANLPERKPPPNKFPSNLADNFIGREKDLAKLHENIQTANQVAISAVAGMGGVGKSELAKQYISKYREIYSGGICWLNATEDNFVSKLIELSGLGNNEALKQRKYLADKIKYCYNNWQWQGNVLLVFDDVQNYRHIQAYLPNEDRFKVLITTRKRLGKPVVRLDLDVLEPTAALDLLFSFVGERGKGEREIAEELCQWLGYLPVGLDLVGRYLAKRKISLVKMLERLKNKSLEHKSIKDVPEESNAEKGVQAAFELSWDTLQENPLAKITAYFLSLFALAPIPQELLENANLREDWEDVEDALLELEDLYLVKYLPEESYLLNSLIREFLHTKEAQLNSEKLKRTLGKVIVAKGKEIPENITVYQVTTLSPFIPHLQEVATNFQDYLTDEDLITPFTCLGRFYYEQGLYNLAEPWLVQGKEIALTRLGESHADTATMLHSLAELYRSQRRYEDAEPLYKKAIEIVKIVLPDNHPQLANHLNNLANLYRSQGRYEEAEPLYKKAIEIAKIVLPDNHPSLANSLNNLANLYRSQGRYEEAEPLYKKAIEIVKTALPDNHPSLATSLNNLANLYGSQGRYEEAEPLYKKAIEIVKTALPDNHSQLANHLNNLARLYKLQGRYEQAESLFLQAIEIAFNSLGEEHPSTKKIRNSFLDFLQEVVAAGRKNELSSNPLTRELIENI